MTSRELLALLVIPISLAAFAPAQSAPSLRLDKRNPAPVLPVLGPCVPGATSMLIDLDGSFSVVTFDGLGGNGPASPGDPCQRNDDDVTLAIPLGFTFDLFGQTFTSVFVNNNGNVSFGASFDTFTSTGFPVTGFPMVAPFWADVDTRALTSGTVYYRSEPGRFTVIWDHVGYYIGHADKLSTFELILTDGNDPLIGLGNNVAFCYDDMQWTTGDASGGTAGFGGVPATAGVNHGNGTDFFQIGRFDAPGIAYDGPGGASDGVDFLDDTCYTFSVGGQINAPPIFVNPPHDCITVAVGQTLNFTIEAIGPETNQTVTLVNDGASLANFSSVETPGNPASSVFAFTPDCSQFGLVSVQFTATDNYNPTASTQLSMCIDVQTNAVEYCFGDGPTDGGPDCPCGNSLPGNLSGCLTSLGMGAHLSGYGCPSLANDTLQLVAYNLILNRPTFFYGATLQNNGGLGSFYGDGLTCLAGTRKRIGKVLHPASTTITVPLPGHPAISVQFPPALGQTHNYQAFFRNQGGPCGLGFNTTNGVSVVWQP